MWNSSYITMLRQFSAVADFHWHSEHLGFTSVRMADGEEVHGGTILPLPFNDEVLGILVPRIRLLQHYFSRPFLIENTSYYLPDYPNNQYCEIDFLNQLMRRCRCGLVFDLYNFYCNAINFGFDPYEELCKLDMSSLQSSS